MKTENKYTHKGTAAICPDGRILDTGYGRADEMNALLARAEKAEARNTELHAINESNYRLTLESWDEQKACIAAWKEKLLRAEMREDENAAEVRRLRGNRDDDLVVAFAMFKAGHDFDAIKSTLNAKHK